MSSVIMNGRVLLVPSNGQARVAAELNRRLQLQTVQPGPSMASGIKGHLWEQAMLPLRLAGRPLWSPSTSAPIGYRNQVVTVHDIGFVDAPQYFAPRFAAIYNFIVGRVSKSARHLVTVSQFSRQRLIEHYKVPEDRVSFVYLGVSEAFSIRPADEVRDVLQRHGLADTPYVIAFSGADPRKNTGGVLAAWNKLAASRKGAKLVLFGRSSNSSVFGASQLTGDVTDVVRVGGVSDAELACLFTGSRGLIFPSLYEGFGLPIIEAAASGAPIVCSNVTSMPEVAPSSAILLDPASTNAIAQAIEACLGNEPDAAMRAGLSREAGRFSWDTAARSYADLFATVFG
ncbi:MAG TPA: glycosyltransferase family 1 protein [Arsenicitalea sp.]|jgi:glycosyltransferase involved in cell wall biosynthesis|nr:glycosyltransferase family 1 protein [Arsenicitalea sp.]